MFVVGDKLVQNDGVNLIGMPDAPYEVVAVQMRHGVEEVFIETFPYFAWIPSHNFKLAGTASKQEEKGDELIDIAKNIVNQLDIANGGRLAVPRMLYNAINELREQLVKIGKAPVNKEDPYASDD